MILQIHVFLSFSEICTENICVTCEILVHLIVLNLIAQAHIHAQTSDRTKRCPAEEKRCVFDDI